MGLGVGVVRPGTAVASSNAQPMVHPPTPWLNSHLTSSTTWTSLIYPWSMGLMCLWPLTLPPMGAPVGYGARPTSWDSAPVSSELRVAAITHAPFSRPMSTVAIPGAVARQITQGISRLGALMLTATLRMIKPAPLHALVVPTMMLSSAHKASINYSMHVLASLNY